MIRALASLVMLVLGNAVGIVVAGLVLPDFRINLGSVMVSVLFFTGVNVILSPFVMKVALKYLPALRGGIALVATFVALLVTVLLTNGLTISSVSTWVLAPFIIWAATVAAGVVLPMLLFKKALQTSGDDVAKE